MKTTIDLPEHILHRAKMVALQRKITLRELVLQGLEYATRQPAQDAEAERKARAATLIAALSRGRNTEPVGRLDRDEIYDRHLIPAMNPPNPPKSKIGNEVVFAPPVAVSTALPRVGRIKDEVWSPVSRDDDWGWYVYTSQLIEWNAKEHGQSIRITYYYQPFGGDNWLFGGQYSIEDRPSLINEHLQMTLAKGW